MEITDGIDDEILALLSIDGRMSMREIGRRLHIAEATARNRIKRLQKIGALNYVTLIHERVSRKLAGAYVGIHANQSVVREVAVKIADLQECTFSGIALGKYNIFAYFLTADRQSLYRLMRESVETIPGVLSISVREILEVAKHPYQIVSHPAQRESSHTRTKSRRPAVHGKA
jgi:Lrp/AsnC family transcriptional regulator, regulator for asnA, asnC and gidA